MKFMLKNVLKMSIMVGALLPCWGAGEVQALPAPVTTGGMPLMEAIANQLVRMTKCARLMSRLYQIFYGWLGV